MAKSFWQRGEDYAKKRSPEKSLSRSSAGVAPWQKPWKPGEQISAENFSTGKKYSGGNSLYLMSRGDPRWTRRQPLGNLQPDSGSGRTGPQGRERDAGSILHGSQLAGSQGRERARRSRTRKARRSTKNRSGRSPSVSSTRCLTWSKPRA